VEHPDFFTVVQQHWTAPSHIIDAAKFKNLKLALKVWKANLSNLKANIANVKSVLTFLQIIEEFRDLSIPKWNFKQILDSKL
jgi:hypothetical protein